VLTLPPQSVFPLPFSLHHLPRLRAAHFTDIWKYREIPVTVYTIYFHLQHIGPTASEKDNMVISFLTSNIISTKIVSSIAVFSISDDYCFFFALLFFCIKYHTQVYTLPFPRNSNINSPLVFTSPLDTSPYFVIYMCIVWFIITMTLIFLNLLCFVFMHTTLCAVCVHVRTVCSRCCGRHSFLCVPFYRATLCVERVS